MAEMIGVTENYRSPSGGFPPGPLGTGTGTGWPGTTTGATGSGNGGTVSIAGSTVAGGGIGGPAGTGGGKIDFHLKLTKLTCPSPARQFRMRISLEQTVADCSGLPAGSTDSLRVMLQLGGVFMALTFVVFAAYGVCAAAVRDRLAAHPRVTTGLRAVFTASFVGLSARMAVAG